MGNISTLKINKLTREQYIKASKGELSGKTIDEDNEIYLVPPTEFMGKAIIVDTKPTDLTGYFDGDIIYVLEK